MRLVPSAAEIKPTSTGIDRRRAPRLALDRPAKIARHAAARYEPAITVNVSTSGALLDIVSARPVTVGERLGVAVAWAREGLISSTNVLPAKVVRCDGPGDGPSDRAQRIAVEFLVPAEVELAAAA